MNGLISFLCCHLVSTIISTQVHENYFPLVDNESVAEIYIDQADYNVVETAADMLSDDIERITGKKVSLHKVRNHREINTGCAIIAGTLGQSHLIEWIVKQNRIDIKEIEGKWESFMIMTTEHPEEKTPLLVVIGSDRRGTAYGLTTLCEEIGVSPWYWWADVQPQKKESLFIKNGCHVQKEPSVQYRGIFINDERFGGWAKWVEQTFDKETGKVGPKVYEKVFELLLRLKANYLWPAMHNGSAAFNSNPENARLADDYAIVMGTSHCEQMLRNNEDEWKNAGTQVP